MKVEESSHPKNQRRRHLIVTVWLVLILVGNLLVSASNLILFVGWASGTLTINPVPNQTPLANLLPGFQPWSLFPSSLLTFVNAVAGYQMLRWKKNGFYLVCFTSAITLIMNNALGANILMLLMPPASVVILYALLHIGSPSAWNQMEFDEQGVAPSSRDFLESK